MSRPKIIFNYDDFHLKKFNSLLIIDYAGIGSSNSRMVKVRCDCGKEKVTYLYGVRTGKTKSCGCLTIKKSKERRTTHGLRGHPLYDVWHGMNSRCYYKKSQAYRWYGAKGVNVCDEWKTNFKAFYDWAIDKWEPGLQLDKDILGNGFLYSPETCCFVTSKENIRAQHHLTWFTINGETKLLSDWCKIYNINMDTVYNRIKRKGLDIEKALTTPINKNGSSFRMTQSKYNMIFQMTKDGIKQKDICTATGFCRSHVRKVLDGKFKYAGGLN